MCTLVYIGFVSCTPNIIQPNLRRLCSCRLFVAWVVGSGSVTVHLAEYICCIIVVVEDITTDGPPNVVVQYLNVTLYVESFLPVVTEYRVWETDRPFK